MVKEKVQACGRIGQSGIDLVQPETCREHPTHSWGSRAFSPSLRVIEMFVTNRGTVWTIPPRGRSGGVEDWCVCLGDWWCLYMWTSICLYLYLDAVGAHTPAEEQQLGLQTPLLATHLSQNTQKLARGRCCTFGRCPHNCVGWFCRSHSAGQY